MSDSCLPFYRTSNIAISRKGQISCHQQYQVDSVIHVCLISESKIKNQCPFLILQCCRFFGHLYHFFTTILYNILFTTFLMKDLDESGKCHDKNLVHIWLLIIHENKIMISLIRCKFARLLYVPEILIQIWSSSDI